MNLLEFTIVRKYLAHLYLNAVLNLPGVVRCRLRRFGLNLQLVHLARAVLLQLY